MGLCDPRDRWRCAVPRESRAEHRGPESRDADSRHRRGQRHRGGGPSAAARVEIKSERPRAEILELCRLELQRVAVRLAPWISTKLDRFADAFMIAAGKKAGADLVQALFDQLPQLYENLKHLLHSLINLN